METLEIGIRTSTEEQEVDDRGANTEIPVDTIHQFQMTTEEEDIYTIHL